MHKICHIKNMLFLSYFFQVGISYPTALKAVNVIRAAIVANTPEAGSGKVDFKADSFEDVRSDAVKPLVVRLGPPGFKRDQLGVFGFHEVDHFQGPGGPLVELFEGVAVDRQLQGLIGFLRIHHLGRGLELGNHIIGFDEVNDSTEIHCRDEHDGRREIRGKMMKNGRWG
jgi:hypothetical protein